MNTPFTNLDALWLSHFADGLDLQPDRNAAVARLRLIAQHIQSLDDKNAALASLQGKGYAEGVRDAEARMRQRSNVLSNPAGEDDTGAAIISQINRLEAEGRVKRAALGERTLDDKPHLFNGPLKRGHKPVRSTEVLDLDLSSLDDL